MVTNDSDAARLGAMVEELRAMRHRLCDPKNNSNSRYHAFSSAVSSLLKVIQDLETERASAAG